ncbi:MAG TPA: metallophosphoesterase family protein [Chitinispirillaceae bacterium]|nr:metallophosphoesterase family protein [Chitinispirillaceae bacterium]
MVTINKDVLKIGVISDTHGLFRKQIYKYFENVDCIIHAGDIGSPEIIENLLLIAPLYAVLGNTDPPFIFTEYNYEEIIETPHHKIFFLHSLAEIGRDVVKEGFSTIISGHTHRPLITTENNVLYLNPGSAGPVRSNLPVSAALLYVDGEALRPELIELDYV